MAVKDQVQQAKKQSQVRDSASVEGSDKKLSIYERIEKQMPGFELALPEGWDASRFTRIAITALRTNDKLREAAISNPASLLGALMLSAQLGLEPNSPLHEAVLIPYGNKIEFQLEYRGLLKLMWQSNMVQEIDFDSVCANDEFRYSKGKNSEFYHKPAMQDRGEPYAYYAYAKLQNGGFTATVMTKHEVEEHGKRFSKAYHDPRAPWQTDFEAMAHKTVLKQLLDKKMPKSTQDRAMQQASLAAAQDMSTKEMTDAELAAKMEKGEKISIGDIADLDDTDDTEDAEVVEENEPDPTETPKSPENDTATPEADHDTTPPPEEAESEAQPDQNTSAGVDIEEMPDPDTLESDTEELKFNAQFEAYATHIKQLGGDIAEAVEDETGMRVLPDELAPMTKHRIMNKAKHLYDELYALEQMETPPGQGGTQDELEL